MYNLKKKSIFLNIDIWKSLKRWQGKTTKISKKSEKIKKINIKSKFITLFPSWLYDKMDIFQDFLEKTFKTVQNFKGEYKWETRFIKNWKNSYV